MKKKKMFVLLFLLGLIFNQAYTEKPEKEGKIKLVNDKVAQIEKGIKEKTFSSIDIRYVVEAYEIGAINTHFYYNFDFKKRSVSLVCVKFEIPKEIYWNEFYYFFDDDEKLIKFTKQTFNREDNPPKQAIIYDQNGKKVWSNYPDQLPIDNEELKSIFKGFHEKFYNLELKHLRLM